MNSMNTGGKLKLFAVLGWGVAIILVIAIFIQMQSPTSGPSSTTPPARTVIPLPTPTVAKSAVDAGREVRVIRVTATPIPTTIPLATIPLPTLSFRSIFPVPTASVFPTFPPTPRPLPTLPTIPTIPTWTDPPVTITIPPPPELAFPTIAPPVLVSPTPKPSATAPPSPTTSPTMVPVDSASRVAQTVETTRGVRVDITVMGFADNRLRFNQLAELINEEERLLGASFPSPKVTLRRVQNLPGSICGHNQVSYQSRYAGEPYRIENAVIRLRMDSKCDDTYGSVAHEVAHTWFHGNDRANWIDEGLANAMENQIKEARPEYGPHYPPVTYCATYRNIQELEQANPHREASGDASGFRCNYRLGDGIFAVLRDHFGTYEFNRRIAKLARQSSNRTDGNQSVEDVRSTFQDDSGEAREIIDQWYQRNPVMRIFRHLDQVTYMVHPTLDGDMLHFAGKTTQPGMVLDFVLGPDPFLLPVCRL